MNRKNEELSVVMEKNSPVEFDWDMYENENKIPKYRDIISDINSKNSKLSKSFLAEFAKYEGNIDISSLVVGTISKGYVSEIKEREIIVNIGNKDNVIIDRRGSEEKICRQLKIGQEIDVLITKIQDVPFLIKGSVADLVRIRVDNKMRDFFENKVAIEAYVKEIIPAGFLLDIDIDNITVDAFMPNTLADVNKLYDPNLLLGKMIYVMLETLQQDKGIYVVSRKKYLKTLIPDKIKEIRKYSRDHVFTGFVTGTRNFGIFIQFEECLTGMIHKANIRKDYQDKIETIQPGTTIDFYIKDIIKGGSQIILTQILEESLWDTVRVGDNLKGKVISLKPFGALIELDYETNALIQNTYLNKSEKKLEFGDEVNVIVISINRDDRKIYLTFSDDTESIERLKEKSDDLEKLKQKFNNK